MDINEKCTIAAENYATRCGHEPGSDDWAFAFNAYARGWCDGATEGEMTPTDKAIETLVCIARNGRADRECAHSDADAALVKFLREAGHGEVADAYECAREAVGFWYA